MLWYDLSPMRPDEFGRQEAYRWTEAVAIQRAYGEGLREIDAEGQKQQQAAQQSAEMDRRLQAVIQERRMGQVG